MYLLQCELTLHDTLYFATREMGPLFETERYIHNYALAYALFSNTLLSTPFFCKTYRPAYANDLAILNQEDVYVTPARPLSWDYVMVTWKIGQTAYYRKSEKFGESKRNYPANIGRAKELAPESAFRFYVLSNSALTLPHWIRLGKWMSKAQVEVLKAEEVQERRRQGSFTAICTLNPLDLTRETLQTFDIISMPPSSLVTNAKLEGSYYEIDGSAQGIPADMHFTVPS
jgi:CRISPR-associated protein Csc1